MEVAATGSTEPPVSGWGRAPPSRVDIQATTASLMLVLRDNKSGYVECLRKYFARKLAKAELDQYVKTVLGAEHLYLHNQFISSILANAQSRDLPPGLSEKVLADRAKRPSLPARKASRRQTDDTPQHSMVQDAYLKSLAAVQINMDARNRTSTRMFEAKVASSSRLVSTRVFRRSASTVDSAVPTCLELGALPDAELVLRGDAPDEPLRQRMEVIAREDGLMLSKRAPEVVVKALETHLKNVVASTLQAVAALRGAMGPAEGESADARPPLSLSEFIAAARLVPTLFGDESPITRERLLVRDV
eukprot:c5267_g1_i1.p1 GENE.c5267_g1_i1~~c5267_g1_i1.p1  ORF type:complete len:304 (+),score=61.31 c5267_g1_i1:166-1077(+)